MDNKMMGTFKLKGLNIKIRTGIYATVECGKEDWFHSCFDENAISVERQYALFHMFKKVNGLWSGNHTVQVEYDKISSGGVPVNPIIKQINLDL